MFVMICANSKCTKNREALAIAKIKYFFRLNYQAQFKNLTHKFLKDVQDLVNACNKSVFNEKFPPSLAFR